MRKSLFSKAILPAILFLSFFSIIMTSCEVGMGESVDLEAPVLESIIFPGENVDYVNPDFTMRGTARDNRKIARVEIEYEYNKVENGVTKLQSGKKYASISGNIWSCNFSGTFDDDYEVNFTITVYDGNNNTSEDSVKTRSVKIDQQKPILQSFMINRNNSFDIGMAKKDYLQAQVEKMETDSGAKDDLQNEEFTLIATLSDNYQIGSAEVKLYNEQHKLLASKKIEDSYTPRFTFKQSDLGNDYKVSGKEGVRYIIPEITVLDKAENTYQYTSEEYLICWYPDSDKPKAYIPLVNKENGVEKISIGKTTKIPINIFDDDGISNVYYGLVSSAEWAQKKTNLGTTKAAFESYKSGNTYTGFNAKNYTTETRDESLSIDATEAGTFFLVVAIEDKKKIAGYNSVWNYYDIQTNVDSMDIPIVIVSAPAENSSPDLTDGKEFTITGFTLDDKNVSKISIAWLSAGDSQIEGTREALKEIAKNGNFTKKTIKVDGKDVKIYAPTITKATAKDTTYDKYKDTFSQTFDISSTGDFGSVNDIKTFLIYAYDEEGNITDRTFRLGAYKTDPIITLQYNTTSENPANENDWQDCPTSMDNLEQQTYYFRVKAVGANNISLKTTSPNPNTVVYAHEKSSTTKTVTTSFTKFSYTPTKDGRFEITVNAEDILGNKASQKCVLSFKEKAELKSISTTNRNNTTLTQGQTLVINAAFSTNVNVDSSKLASGKPYITLVDSANSGNTVKAEYKSHSNDTITFEYTVEADKVFTAVRVNNTNPITDSQNSINANISKPLTATTNQLTTGGKKASIKIDSEKPSITAYNPPNNDVLKANGDGKFIITLTFNENVKKGNGTIYLQRTSDWSIPPVITEDVFLSVYGASTSENKIKLLGTDTGQPKYEKDSSGKQISFKQEGPYKKYTQGLTDGDGLASTETKTNGARPTKVAGKMIPDTRTKYVLDFDIDISGSSDKVITIRNALEAVGYHKTQYDISQSNISISGKTVSIEVTDADFIDKFKNGVEYELYFGEGAFIDMANNKCNAVSQGTYKFVKDKVAKPYIRVKRVTSNSRDVAPSVQTQARIDSETPGASIKYYKSNATTELSTKTSTTEYQHNYIKDATKDEIDAGTETTYNGAFTVGTADTSDKEYYTAEKIWIKAVATKSELADSDPDYEGAFRTINYYEKPSRDPASGASFRFYGCNVAEGAPSISGFPFMQNGRIYIRGYTKTVSGTNSYILVTWEVISDYTNQTHAQNYQNPADTACTYGEVLYTYNKTYHGGSSD